MAGATVAPRARTCSFVSKQKDRPGVGAYVRGALTNLLRSVHGFSLEGEKLEWAAPALFSPWLLIIVTWRPIRQHLDNASAKRCTATFQAQTIR